MLHVVVLIRSVLIPDEVSDETPDHETITTQLLQKVAFALKLLVRVGSSVTTLLTDGRGSTV